MEQIITRAMATSSHIARPLPQIDIAIRPAVLSDIPFMDRLQKLHTRQVGWMPTAQFEGKIAAGHVLIAEEVASSQLPVQKRRILLWELTTGNWQLLSSATASAMINTSSATTWGSSIK